MTTNTFKLTLEESAINRINDVLKTKPQGSFLRIEVKSGGCAGFSTSFKIDNKIEKDDIIIEKKGAKVVINQFIANFLKEASLIFYTNMLTSHFQLKVKEATETCSCGSSFSI